MRISLVCIMVVIILTLAIFSGCGGPEASALEGVKWSLVSYGPKTSAILESVPTDTPITAFFDSEKQQVTGSGGCNTYFGSYEVDGEDLTIPGPIAVTEMWCGDEIGERERIYLEALQSAESYEVKGDGLTIYCGDMLLSFKPE